jgi:hypothetical protein
MLRRPRTEGPGMTDETAHDALRSTGRQAMREVLGEA